MSGVDVLEVLSRIADGDGDIECDALRVRSAVAKLIDATMEYRKVCGWAGEIRKERAALNLDAALARVTGGAG